MEYKTGGLLEMARDFLGYTETTEKIDALSTPYKPETPEPRAYHAGGMGSGSYGFYSALSGGQKYFNGIAFSGAIKNISHLETRRNARMAYHDTPQARSIVERMADTVADIGLRLEAVPMFAVLGITQEEARAWGRDTEGRFHLHAMDKNQHRSGTLIFYQAQRLYQIGQHRDNDIFVRLYYSLDRNLQSPLQFEFVDPDQIRGYGWTTTGGFNEAFRDGIERDAQGREKNYKVWVKKPGQSYQYEELIIPAKGSKSGKIFMLHGFTPEYASQGRGFSRLHFALQEFQEITDFRIAHIKKAISDSMHYAQVVNKDLAPGNPYEGVLTNSGVGAAGDQFGNTPNPSASAQNVTDNALMPVQCYSIPEATAEVAGSTVVFHGQRGDEIKLMGNSAPGDNYDKFVDAFTAHLSAAVGMPIEVLLMKFNQNYSASRGALILFWRVVEMWRQEMAADFLNPYYEMWLSLEIAAGRIKAPGWQDPVLRRAWLNANWIGMPLPDIDPSKTAKARQMNMAGGLTTGTREARGLNGSSHEANMAQLEQEFGEKPPAPWKQSNGGGGNPGNSVQALAEALVEELLTHKED